MYPKVLVVSNECFTPMSSNGRTLGNFFKGWPKDKLAQFYISTHNPDFDYCDNYFNVTDSQALQAFKTGKCKGGKVTSICSKTDERSTSSSQGIARNSITMLIRNLVWMSGRWKNCDFNSWVEEFNPDIVLLQAGDSPFMFRLATSLANRFNAKLVIYNSEGYYFKNFDYFRSKGVAKLLYPAFLYVLKKALEKAYKKAEYVVYLCDELKEAYDNKFDMKSYTIYTASDFKPASSVLTNNKTFTTSYCGNLGVGRHKGLIEIANCLQKISSDLFLDVYGKLPSECVKFEFEQCSGIRYHGLVSYEEVKQVILNSDLIVHTESFDEFYIEDLKFAFSTKIADCLSSGKCFLLYAPKNYACTKYIEKNKVAFVANDKDSLYSLLENIINNPSIRSKYVEDALNLTKSNHSTENNVKYFQKLLLDI